MRRSLLRPAKSEASTTQGAASEGNPTGVGPHDAIYYGQAQSIPPGVTIPAWIQANKGLEDLIVVAWVYAWAIVLNT